MKPDSPSLRLTHARPCMTRSLCPHPESPEKSAIALRTGVRGLLDKKGSSLHYCEYKRDEAWPHHCGRTGPAQQALLGPRMQPRWTPQLGCLLTFLELPGPRVSPDTEPVLVWQRPTTTQHSNSTPYGLAQTRLSLDSKGAWRKSVVRGVCGWTQFLGTRLRRRVKRRIKRRILVWEPSIGIGRGRSEVTSSRQK